jgi:hypothetical protein
VNIFVDRISYYLAPHSIVPRSVSTGSASTSPSSELVDTHDSIGASTCPLNPSILPKPDDDSHTTFEKVATVVAVYKLARYWAERASAEPELYTIEQREQKQAAYEAAGAMLLELNKGADNLSGASRQQLHILESELQSQGRSLITLLLNPLYSYTQFTNVVEVATRLNLSLPPAANSDIDSVSEYGRDDPFLTAPRSHFHQQGPQGL